MKGPLLELKNIAAGYGGRPLYRHVDTRVEPGELVAFLGANGAGKSTLLRTVTGRLAPVEGTVEIAGTDLAHLSGARLARLVSVVTPAGTMAGALTVEELTALGRQPHTGFLGRLSGRDRHAVAEALMAVGMAGFAQRQVASLSDGERQKVMIARALAQETPLIVLDEPTAFLDVASRLETMQLLADLAREHGKGVVLSSHDVSSSLRLASKIWLLQLSDSPGGERRFVAGTPDDIVGSGEIDRLFPSRPVRFDSDIIDFIPVSKD